MKHSVLIIVGTNLVYQHAPLPKPSQGNVELLKDYTLWQQSVKSFLIKEEHRAEFDTYLTDIDINKNGEVPIPFDVVDIYFDVRSGKNHARMKSNVVIDSVSKKVVEIKEVCKVCHNDIILPVDQAQNFFPICNPCLADLKTLVLEKRTTLNLQ